MKKFTVLAIITITFSFVFAASESFSQEIKLKPNRRENTYKTWNVNGILDIQLLHTNDRGKALEGAHKIKYKCKRDKNEFRFRIVTLKNGRSERLEKVMCAYRSKNKTQIRSRN